MAESPRLPHLFLKGTARSDEFAGGGGKRKPPPKRDREDHSRKLLARLELAREAAEAAEEETLVAGIDAKEGIYLEFLSEPDYELAWRSMESRGTRLLNVRESHDDEGKKQFKATLFVPKGKLRALEDKLERYATESRAR